MSAGEAAVSAARRPGRDARQGTLRTQFTLVIFLLAFLPNLVLTLTARPGVSALMLAVWMVLVAALCGLVGYLLSGVLLRPLSRLEAEVQRGDFAHARQAQPHRDDPAEIRALRAAFADLLERLSTEQARRSAFMATLVHDLKTPLIATGHLIRALTEHPLPDAERREVGRELLSENARLLALVGQMADAHRFEREEVEVQPRPTDLRALLDGVARRLHPQAQARGLTLSVAGEGRTSADPAVLERAVTNLAENALRYAHTGVILAVTPAGVEVHDDGPGLGAPLAELAQPFNAQPATIAGQQYTAGTTGLGLFIARRIAEAHGGALTYARAPLTRAGTAVPPPPSAHAGRDAARHGDLAAVHSVFALNLPEVTP
ncbi:HAMP domain-containing histidine kinase [Deinococcus metallilatus]|uniref:histidine kinase n=1 Tax=Deinococcus metallilatus TaxID=1211322 RepID=A0AAJ5F428_9DEIO|nr:HAMP domain-containing sensor histidine kinase [Deinococcus metallilatus]MBB5296071.1 signal transduction histidine kinase [Deinococcus metallilatus]QBY08121.1 HAMP domain-containing histidine kinase [Deinococcus metallilatus]RXJ11854.1 HAMP domain-containing histidine kinase [Deinococcus metallilatus]TLK25915.1 HAMP domain-containing histidine kinase [Deinococcus metallilatus]